MNVAQVLEASALEHPEQPAIIHGGRILTYAEWWQRVRKVQTLLSDLGAGPGDRVALLLPNSAEFLESLYGILAAGCVVVPINTRLHPKEYEYILEQSGSRVLIFDEAYDKGVQSLTLDGSATRLVRVGSDSAADSVSYEEAVEAVRPADRFQTQPDDLAWLFYTSGTTGRPKGAMVTHDNLDFMTKQYARDVYAAGPQDRAMHAGPLTHGSGLWSIPLTAAAATHIIPSSLSFDAAEILGLVEEHAVTKIVFVSPTMIKMLLESPACDSADCSSLRFLGYGGAPIHPDDQLAAIDRWGNVLCNIYGQGECPMTLSMLSPTDHRDAVSSHPEWLRSVGRVRADIDVAVCDDDGARLEAGEIGEICVTGTIVMKGYWNDQVATEEAFRNGWYHTGDLGRYDGDGFLYLLDRAKELIISGGANIYPREVEGVILEHQAVADAAVFGIPDRHWGESVVAVVVPRDGQQVSTDELVALLRDNLASYKKPRFFVFAEELPRSAYGKVLKRQLAEKYSELAEAADGS